MASKSKNAQFSQEQIDVLVSKFGTIERMSTENWQKLEDLMDKFPITLLEQLTEIKNLGYIARKIIAKRLSILASQFAELEMEGNK